MKKFLIIPLLLLSLTVFADKWYVSPRGNDANAGTDSSSTGAWKTWGKAFNWESINAGDTVYFLGGVYYKVLTDGDNDWYYPNRATTNGTGYAITRDGTITDTLKYWAYPGHVPILDCSTMTTTFSLHYGIRATGVNYVHFKGLHMRNVKQNIVPQATTGWSISASNTKVENCKIYNIWGNGFYAEGGTALYVVNSDAWNCADSLGTGVDGYNPGGQGTGFNNINTSTTTGSVYFVGCRAWKCSDQGFSSYSKSVITWDKCWSFVNGYLGGGGHGFKLGWVTVINDFPMRIVTNSVAVYNKSSGITTNDNTYANVAWINAYNNSVYKNQYGIVVYNTTGTDALELKRTFRNNVSYGNTTSNVAISTNASYTHSNNSWDSSPAITVSDADFVSVDSTGLTGARGEDGSLPVLDFLKLAEGSDLIGAGIGVGLLKDGAGNYHNDPPDLGAYAYSGTTPEPPERPEAATTTPVAKSIEALLGGNILSGESISARGIVWGTSANPTTANNVITVTGTTGAYTTTLRGLTSNTTYHVRSYATNAAGTSYGADVSFTTPAYTQVGSGNKILFYNGKQIIIK